MTIARVRTILAGPQIVGGGVSDLYFLGSSGDEQQMVSSVATFWTDLAPGLCSGNSADVDASVYNLDEATGDVVSIVTVATDPAVINFSATGDPLGPANQGLIQWLSDGVANNRPVRGRMYVPAFEEGSNTGGKPNTLGRALMQDAADALIAGGGDEQLVIWHRPGVNPGSQHPVIRASTWGEWAVLRSRRD